MIIYGESDVLLLHEFEFKIILLIEGSVSCFLVCAGVFSKLAISTLFGFSEEVDRVDLCLTSAMFYPAAGLAYVFDDF